MSKLKITLIKSVTHRKPQQRNIIKSLGLNHIHSSVIQLNNASIRGAIFKVAHLISVKEVNK